MTQDGTDLDVEGRQTCASVGVVKARPRATVGVAKPHVCMWLAGVAGVLSMAEVQLLSGAETHLATCHKSMFMPCMSHVCFAVGGSCRAGCWCLEHGGRRVHQVRISNCRIAEPSTIILTVTVVGSAKKLRVPEAHGAPGRSLVCSSCYRDL
jgi:hypothetical protein